MEHLHRDATPIKIENDKQVGWQLETKDFTLQAVEQDDKTVNAYVTWGDDMGDDITNHESWADVRSYIQVLLRAIET